MVRKADIFLQTYSFVLEDIFTAYEKFRKKKYVFDNSKTKTVHDSMLTYSTYSTKDLLYLHNG